MEYKEVIVIKSSGDYDNVICFDLMIDGKIAEYDYYADLDATTFRFGNFGESLHLPMKLVLNIDNPKETLDRFFKLLSLA